MKIFCSNIFCRHRTRLLRRFLKVSACLRHVSSREEVEGGGIGPGKLFVNVTPFHIYKTIVMLRNPIDLVFVILRYIPMVLEM